MSDIKGIVENLEKTMWCNCDLDTWEPEEFTGHSWVCRIHKMAIDKFIAQENLQTNKNKLEKE